MTTESAQSDALGTADQIVEEVISARSGVRVGGAVRAGGTPIAVFRPAEGTADVVWGGGVQDALDALSTSATAMPDRAATPPAARAETLRAVAHRLQSLAGGEWARLVSRETGKRLQEAQGEIAFSATYFSTFADVLEAQPEQHEQRVPGHSHAVAVSPRGLAVALTPWNFPVSIPARKIAPALAAGCGVLFKPSEIATLSSMVLAAVLDELVPQGLVSTVLGSPHDVVDSWVASEQVGVLSFTGSTRVGRLVAASTGPRFLPTVLELGGCAPFLVLSDADPASAVTALMVTKFRNNGQSCIAANQILVAREIADGFVDDLVERVRALRVGDPLDASTDVGPMAPPGDPARLSGLVEQAVARGARAIGFSGSLPPTGHYAGPAVLLDVPADAAAFQDEIFGPLAAVRVYDDLDEALALHRATGYGLAGYVCGTEPEVATSVGRRLRAGIVGVNTGTPNHPSVPFGGVGLSGLGYEGGRQGLEAFQAFQTLAVGGP